MDYMGVVVGAVALVVILFLLLQWKKRAAQIAQQTERKLAELREQSWHATVTGIELQDVRVTNTKVKLLTVHYRQEDGQEGSLVAYENDAMRGLYGGALAFYKDAPGWDELSRWKEGDRLFKPVGEVFPRREEG